ncbi:hypothetical protein IFM46972_01317 [Aspergillus udagawae]|uniref:Nuclease S1 n=1 Tax=Aspergillus udagawae TaxID=91492 RepID=A0A8H3N5P3_9EURO|nr:hypothetical protein IFM46972_01317 [Aspergillus udagawae]
MNLLYLLPIFIYSFQPVACWGDLGHRTVAYLAQRYFSKEAAQLIDDLLPSSDDWDISDAAVWADKVKFHRPFTRPWHYIDALDHPPDSCQVSFTSDCGHGGCIISAIQNMTNQVNDPNIAQDEQAEALKFLIHFLGDIHQPLHAEALERGGNEIHVCFDKHCGKKENLHGIWDTEIPHKINGIKHNEKHNDEKEPAERWAASLFRANRFRPHHAECSNIQNPLECATLWAKETNRLNCDYVLKRDIDWLENHDLGRDYYAGAAPIVNEQIYKAGVRLATWINTLAAQRPSSTGFLVTQDGKVGRNFEL